MATRKTRSSRRRVASRPATYRRSSSRGGRPWNREEIAFLRQNYRNNETAWVARQLGRTVYSVRYKASDLNIRKANPSIWRGNKGNFNSTVRPSTSRMRRTTPPRRYPRTRWADTTRRIGRQTTGRRMTRTTRW